VALLYVTNNNVRGWVRHYILAGAVLCLVPFFLGASRGAIFAGAGAFLFYLAFATNVKKRLVGFFLVLLTTVTLIFAQNFLGTGVFDRLLSLQQDIESGSASVIRLKIWTDGLHQFLRNPLFGNSLESEYVNFHPHNILIEILISTGLLGFISFILFIVYVFAKSIRITRQAPQYYWIVGIFIVGFIQNQFSGAIYSASWVAMGAALVLGFTLPAKEATVSVVKS
jgi:O-antigen ligase